MIQGFSLGLYIVSFAPLWLAILFTDIVSLVETDTNHWTEWISIVSILIAFIIGSIITYLGFRMAEHNTSCRKEFVLVNAVEEKTITSDMILTYVLPLIAFDFTKWDQMALFILFFGILAFLCVRHNYYFVNVMLELVAGYRVYKCVLKDSNGEKEQMVISRRKMNNFRNDEVCITTLNNEYGFEVKIPQSNNG